MNRIFCLVTEYFKYEVLKMFLDNFFHVFCFYGNLSKVHLDFK